MSHSKFDEIKIPSQIDGVINQNIQRALLEKSKPTRNYRKVITGVSASLLLFTVLGISNPAIASKMSIIQNVFETIQKNFFYGSDQYSTYSTSIGETITSNGVSITLSEVLCDGENLYISYIVEKDPPFLYQLEEDGSKITKLYPNYSENKVSFSDKTPKQIQINEIQGEFIDDYTFVGMTQFELHSLDSPIPEEFMFETTFTSIVNATFNSIINHGFSGDPMQYDKIIGDWNFKIPVTVNRDLSTSMTHQNEDSDIISEVKITKTPFQYRLELTYREHEGYTKYQQHFLNQDGTSFSQKFFGGSTDEFTYVYYFPIPKKETTAIQIILNDFEFNVLKETVDEDGIMSQEGKTKTLGIVFDKTYPIN